MNNTEKRLIPELRFPEFDKDGEWEIKTVEQVAFYENGKAHEQDIDSEGKFKVVNSKFISTDGEVVKYTNQPFCLADENDILMVLSDVPNGRAIAKCFYVDKNDLYTVNQRICKLKPFDANSKLLYYLLNRNAYFLAFDDGIKQTNLKNEDVLNCPIILPKKTKDNKEQQKIASCLSSLDDVIEAHSDKLEYLKQYKKGLLQNLFPQEGETVPKLRFKEFENDGEWEYLNGDLMFNTVTNKNHNSDLPILAVTQEQGAVPRDLINYNVVVTEKSLESYKVVEVGDFIISLRSFQGGIEYSGYRGICSPAYIILRKIESHTVNEFYKYYFKTDLYIRNLNKNLEGLRDGKMVSYSQFSEIMLPNPNPKEQQKIAFLLTSVDDLIKVESDKITQLKSHKKGLLQGLFPKIES